MYNKKDIKEHIIEVTTILIEEYGGDTKKITARLIAEKAGIGLGLINYHFGTKDNLITACVQSIIGKVISDFDVEKKYMSDKERLIAIAINVFDFLFEHPAISRISILGDFNNYTQNCNSIRSQKGFMLSLTETRADNDKAMIAFILTSAMQVAFLGSDMVKMILGYDFTLPEDRANYIEQLVSTLLNGYNKGVENE